MVPVEARAADAQLAARKLRRHLLRCHAARGVLMGPDPSGRLNIRVGRFVKAAVPGFARREAGVSFQGLGYWVRFNALLPALGEDGNEARGAIEAAATYVLGRQTPDGSWISEASGRPVATFEGDWAAIALLQAFWTTGVASYLEGAQGWLRYLVDRGVFRSFDDGVFVTYWSDRAIAAPNTSAELLWVLSELAKVNTCVPAGLTRGLVQFLASVQLPSGELPYRVSTAAAPGRPHYLCYQYNAFEYLVLARYAENTGDPTVGPILDKLAGFLLGGVAPNGACRTSCWSAYPEVDYYTAALALALRRAAAVAGGAACAAADRLTQRLLMMQRPDGSYAYSRRDYGLPWLRDGRSYPRTQAIIAYMLAVLAGLDANVLHFGNSATGIAL